MASLCANCRSSLVCARALGTSGLYFPSDFGGFDIDLCEPCFFEEEEVTVAAGTNELPDRLAHYLFTLGYSPQSVNRIIGRIPKIGRWPMNTWRYNRQRRTPWPAIPGYYWALWLRAADGTHEANEVCWPALNWEVVQVNDNNVNDPNDDEYLSVSVPGVRETQWRKDFKWGAFISPLAKNGDAYPRALPPMHPVDVCRSPPNEREGTP